MLMETSSRGPSRACTVLRRAYYVENTRGLRPALVSILTVSKVRSCRQRHMSLLRCSSHSVLLRRSVPRAPLLHWLSEDGSTPCLVYASMTIRHGLQSGRDRLAVVLAQETRGDELCTSRTGT